VPVGVRRAGPVSGRSERTRKLAWAVALSVAVPATAFAATPATAFAATPATAFAATPQPSPSASVPTEPAAPPVLDPGRARCAPAPTTVVPALPWAQQRLAPQRVWPFTRGAGQVVAVVDSGVDASVPQLAGHVLPGLDVVANGGRADNDCVGH